MSALAIIIVERDQGRNCKICRGWSGFDGVGFRGFVLNVVLLPYSLDFYQ